MTAQVDHYKFIHQRQEFYSAFSSTIKNHFALSHELYDTYIKQSKLPEKSLNHYTVWCRKVTKDRIYNFREQPRISGA